MLNKISETDNQFQPESQKNKTVSYWLLLLPQSKMVILLPGILRMKLKTVFSLLIFLSSLGIKGTITRFLWQTVVATGVKCVCHHCLVTKVAVLLSDL